MPDQEIIRVLGASAGLDLQKLSEWVAGYEEALAPIKAIGKGEDAQGNAVTAVSFDMTKPPLTAKFAEVKLLVGDKAPVGPNETVVCKGKAYISDNLTGVYLVRAK